MWAEPSQAKGKEMSKTALKTGETAETVEFPSFDANKATDQFRSFAEKSVEQSKEAYAKLKTGAEEAQKTLESTFETAKAAANEATLKTIAAMRANAEANFAHLEALVGVKSFSEFVELQTAYLRRRVETGVEQVKDFQALANKAATDVSLPVKNAFEKAIRDVKLA